jgi:polyribonucleotide nucleotidyltransferase
MKKFFLIALAGLAASAALAVSDIPFNGPISEVRVAKIDGQLVINPTPAQLKSFSWNLLWQVLKNIS